MIKAEREERIELGSEQGEAVANFLGLQRRVVIMTPEALVGMMKALKTTFGTAGLTMLYMMGKEKGSLDAALAAEALKGEDIPPTKRLLLETIIHQSRVQGWGLAQVGEYDEEKAAVTVRVENNPLAIAWGKSDVPVCHFLRGYWAGALSEALEKDAQCTETRCMSKGDPYCEFVLQRVAE